MVNLMVCVPRVMPAKMAGVIVPLSVPSRKMPVPDGVEVMERVPYCTGGVDSYAPISTMPFSMRNLPFLSLPEIAVDVFEPLSTQEEVG